MLTAAEADLILALYGLRVGTSMSAPFHPVMRIRWFNRSSANVGIENDVDVAIVQQPDDFLKI
jgi:hypothetical protein